MLNFHIIIVQSYRLASFVLKYARWTPEDNGMVVREYSSEASPESGETGKLVTRQKSAAIAEMGGRKAPHPATSPLSADFTPTITA